MKTVNALTIRNQLSQMFAPLSRLHPQPAAVFQDGVFRQPMTDDLTARAVAFVQLGLTGCDACYAALAQSLDGQWLTFDEHAHWKLAATALSHLLTVGVPSAW